MFIGFAFKFFDKAAGVSVDVGWVIKDATIRHFVGLIPFNLIKLSIGKCLIFFSPLISLKVEAVLSDS